MCYDPGMANETATLRQIDEFAAYLRDIAVNLGQSPLTWSYFAFTARPIGHTCFVSDAAPNTGSSTRGRGTPHRRRSAFLKREARS
jgi:hypothetical protein